MSMILRKRLNKKVGVKECLFYIYIFLYVFQPAIVSIKLIYLLTIINIGIIILCIRDRLIICKNVILIIRAFILFFIYITLMFIVNCIIVGADTSFSGYINILIQFLYLIIAIMALMCLYKASDFKLPSIIDTLIVIGTMQLVCVGIAFISPSVRTFFNNFTIKNSSVSLYVNALLYDARSYGFAENIYDGFGFITAIIIVTTFIKGMDKKNTKLIILSLIMLMMPLLNSRTGLILAAIGIISTLFFYMDKHHISRVIVYLVIVVLAVIMMIYLINYLPEGTQEWIQKGFDETLSIIKDGQISGVYEELLVNDWKIPDGVIIGVGASPEMLGYGNADNGYVQFLWRFGIIGTIIFFTALGYSLRKLYKTTPDKEFKCEAVVLAIFFLIYNFKMFTINNSAGNFIIFAIIIYELERSHYEYKKLLSKS